MARRPNPIVQRLALEGGDEIIAELKRLGLAGEIAGRELKKRFDELNQTGLDPFTASLKRAQLQMQTLSKSFASVGQQFTNDGRRMSLAITAPVVAGFGLAVKAASDFESKMADIARVTDIPTPDGLTQIGDALREMSVRLGVSIGDLQDIAQAAGQAGIPFGDLAGFTEQVATSAIALNLSFDETGQSLAKIQSALGLTTSELTSMVDAIATLADSNNALDAEIIQVVQRIGALGQQAGLSELEVAALGTSVISMGVDAESAGTAIRNMILNLSSGDEATAGFRNALNQLGLDAVDVAQRLQTDGIGVILDIFDRLRRQAPEVRLALLQGLFDRRAAQSLAPLITSLGVLETNLETVGDEANFAGRALQEFARRAETPEQRFRVFKAALDEMAITIGSELMPVVVDLTERLTDLLNAFSDSGPIVRWGVAIAGVAAAIGPVVFAIGQTLGAIGGLLKAGAAAISFFLRWRGAIMLVGAALGLLSAPVAATVAGLAALTGGLVFLATRQSDAARAADAHRTGIIALRDAVKAVEEGIPGAVDQVEELGRAHVDAGLRAIEHAEAEVQAQRAMLAQQLEMAVGAEEAQRRLESGDFFAPALTAAVENLAQTRRDLRETLREIDQASVADLRNTEASAKAAGDAIEDAGDQAAEAGEKAKNAFPALEGTVTRSARDNPFAAATEGAKELGDEAENAGDRTQASARETANAVEGIRAKVVTVPEELRRIAPEADAAARAVDGIGETRGLDEVVEKAQEIPGALQEAVDQAKGDLLSIGEGAAGASEHIKTAFGTLPTDLQPTWQQIAADAQATGPQMVPPFQSASTSITSIIGQMVQAVTEQLRSLIEVANSVASAIVSAMQRAIAAAREARAAVQAANSAGGGGGGGGFAQGGQVFGPGTATSDSIPAWLSAGEFVQPTATVNHYGVDFMEAIRLRRLPQNVMDIMRQAMAGMRGFRDGGLVMPRIEMPRFNSGGIVDRISHSVGALRMNTGGMVPAMASAGDARDMGVLTLRPAAAGDGFRIQGPVDVLETFSRALNRANITATGRGPARLRG